MKRVFFGVTYLILLVMMFTYMMIGCVDAQYDQSIVSAVSNTGLSVIGCIITIPAFVFTIIALATQRDLFEFIRDMFSVFASAFLIISTVVVFTKPLSAVYIPAIELLCSSIIFGLSLYGVIVRIKLDDKRKKEQAQEALKAEEQKKVFDDAVDRKVNEILEANKEETTI